ncbi:MFS general substrate transporter [Delitschia confertaspora ATCC 74209]|uniref:MFS general substrate transporter n=1 Tax=Delitschia confertaspora ATCC 74209 TaxID=1513339 RepID=A0A9P4JQG4_9PLEO|nr:MFS general substrate transporter [Delitschia confertaspora ATCC 74209]
MAGDQIADHSVSAQQYPTTFKLACIVFSLALAVFLYGLDQTIIATAIPKITDDFNALGDVGWYAASYLFTSSAFQLLFGKMFTIFSIKIVYLLSIAIFELGSLICATAPNSGAFIAGRAIAGVGAAGLYSGAVIILSRSAPLETRPRYIGMLGAAVGIASIAGPFLGGAFADRVTWRWCFYINLPLGAITFGTTFWFVHLPQDPKYKAMKWTHLLKQLDIPGVVTLVPAIVCLLLALQWGGTTYSWANARIIALLILFVLLSIAFVVVQRYTPHTCTIPGSIFRSRSIGFTTWFALCTFSVFVVMVYYLPIWFQGIQQVNAFQSGIRTVPLILGFIVFAIISGMLTEVTGYYTPLMIGSSILITIAIGLLSTFKPNTPSSQWIGYQALLGFGVGLGIQCPLVVIQTVLSEQDVPVGTALITLVQNLFGAVFVAIAQAIFQSRLKQNIGAVLPDLDARMLLNGGVTTVISNIPVDTRPTFLRVYSKSVTQVFYLGVALGALSMVGSLGTEWISVKKDKKAETKEETKQIPEETTMEKTP